jgi:hypothetical protein
MEWVPGVKSLDAVVNVAVVKPPPLVVNVRPEAIVVDPSLKSTVPDGLSVLVALVTVAVKVTVLPYVEGFAPDETDIVVSALLTVKV